MKNIIALLCMLVVGASAFAKEPTKVDTFYSLPFRIEFFSARVVSNNEVKLTFTVAETFTNVTHFEILRSTNNVDFVNIGRVVQIDNSPVSHTYDFTDRMLNTITNDVVYYKLKQVTSEGRVTFSNTLPVKLKNSKSKNITLWPQPCSNELNITFENTTGANVSIRMYNSTGLLMHQENLKGTKGSYTIKSTTMNEWSKGSYILQLYSGDEQLGAKTFIKN